MSNIEVSSEILSLPVFYRKGGQAISFNLFDTSFCFVNCHLTAHQNKVKARNRDCALLLNALRMGNRHFTLPTQFDHVFWFGDMNYRIDLPRPEALQLIQQKNFKQLLAKDQLNEQHSKKKVLSSFLLAPPTFPPTYQYEVRAPPVNGVRPYADNTKKRTPAWCDRILYHAAVRSNERSLCEFDAPIVTTSDHSPVFALFSVDALIFRDQQYAPSLPVYAFLISFHSLTLENYRPSRGCCQVAVGGACLQDYQGQRDQTYPLSLSQRVVSSGGDAAAGKSAAAVVWDAERAPPPVLTLPTTRKCLMTQSLLFSVRDYADFSLTNFLVGEGSLHLGSILSSSPSLSSSSSDFLGVKSFSVPLEQFGVSFDVVLSGQLEVAIFTINEARQLGLWSDDS